MTVVPRELQRAIPRDVALTAGGRAVAGLAGLIGVSAGPIGVWLWSVARRSGDVPLVFGPVAAMGLAVLALLLAASVRRQLALLSTGRPSVAVVTSVKKAHHGHGHGTHVSVTYPRIGAGPANATLRMAKSPATGAQMLVLYDPDRPSRCARYPLALARVRR